MSLVRDFSPPPHPPEEHMGLSCLVEAVISIPWWGWPGVVPRQAQGAPPTDIALRPCFVGSWKVGGLEGSFPLTLPLSLPGIVRSVPYGIVLTEEKSKQKQFEILGLQTTLPSP